MTLSNLLANVPEEAKDTQLGRSQELGRGKGAGARQRPGLRQKREMMSHSRVPGSPLSQSLGRVAPIPRGTVGPETLPCATPALENPTAGEDS